MLAQGAPPGAGARGGTMDEGKARPRKCCLELILCLYLTPIRPEEFLASNGIGITGSLVLKREGS